MPVIEFSLRLHYFGFVHCRLLDEDLRVENEAGGLAGLAQWMVRRPGD